jgi:hypothetical protein
MLQCVVFGLAELLFAGISEDLGYAATLAALNVVIQIFEIPVQPLPERTSDTALASAHKPNQKDGVQKVRGSIRRLCAC